MSLHLLAVYSSSDEEDDGDDKEDQLRNKHKRKNYYARETCDHELKSKACVRQLNLIQREACEIKPSHRDSSSDHSKPNKTYSSTSQDCISRTAKGDYSNNNSRSSSSSQSIANPTRREGATDIVIIGRGQRIPGKYLLPPKLPSEPPTEKESGETTAAVEILPGMGTREFKSLKNSVWKDVSMSSRELKIGTRQSFHPMLLEGVQKSEILVNSEELEDDLCDQKNVSDKVETDYKDTISSDKAETDCAAEPNEHSNLQPNSSQYLQPDNASQDCYYYNSEEDYYSYYAQFQQHQSYQQYMQEHHIQGSMEWQPQFDWYPDNSIPPCSNAQPNVVPAARPQQKSFDELLQQDRQLELETDTDVFHINRAAFKSSFRGTKTYRANNTRYIPNHFTQLTKGAKALKKLLGPEEDADRTESRRRTHEILNPKSKKQKKREAWRATRGKATKR